MPKPVCVKCQRFFRPKRNSTHWVEMMPIGNDSGDSVEPGLAEPEKWTPYKVWDSDLWECKGCGHEIIVGHGNQPLAIQHERDFYEWVARSTFKVNDC